MTSHKDSVLFGLTVGIVIFVVLSVIMFLL